MSPVQPSIPIWFEDYLATVSDELADWLLAMPAKQFVLERNIVPSEMSSVKVIRDAGLGDVILTTALVRALGKSGIKVTVSTETRYACVFDNNPYVQEVQNIETSYGSGAYDCTVNLSGYVENAENARRFHNRAWAFGNTLGYDLQGDDLRLELFLTDAEKQFGKDYIAAGSKACASGQIVGVVWRSTTTNRNLTPSRVLEAIAELAGRGYVVVVLDHEYQSLGQLDSNPQVVNATGRLTIRQTFCVIDACAVIVTPDSGPFHIASALGKPTVSFFGCFPRNERATHLKVIDLVVPERCTLFPCHKYSCYNQTADSSGGAISACINVQAPAILHAVEAALAL